MKNRLLFLICFSFCLSGCTILENLDEIFTLQDYSNEKETQHKIVKAAKDHYDALTKAIADGEINQYKNEDSFTKAFGEPILKKDLPDGGQRWLYRYAIYRFAKDQTNIYFDHSGHMVKWEKAECPKFF